jgi:hypothetical protein
LSSNQEKSTRQYKSVSMIENKKHPHELHKKPPQREGTFTSAKLNHTISTNIPSKELKTWLNMKQLPYEQKKLLWHLIKHSNKDNIAIYKGLKQDLIDLINKKLIIDNPISMKSGISVFVLPYTPYLMRELKSLRNY